MGKKKKQLTANFSIENTIQQDSSILIFNAISKMNLEALVAYINEDINIDDTPCKYTLLAEMKEWFNIFKSKGDTYLNQSDGKCLFILCSQGATTKIFTGNNSGHQYSLKYTLKDNDIIELMQCNYSEGHHIKAKLK